MSKRSNVRSKASWELYDHQAAVFEHRAGLPEAYCEQIARKVLEIAEIAAGELALEIGPGTGQIGAWIQRYAQYIGLDLSAGMMDEFKQRLAGVTTPPYKRLLVRADAAAPWPLIAGVAKLIFSSRALHLLPVEHVLHEVFRVAKPNGAMLIVGRVERDPASVRSRMAKEMMQRLRGRGYEAHRGEHQTRILSEACSQRGAEVLPPVAIATWNVSTAPRQSIDSWRTLKGLGGVRVASSVRDEILKELEDWADENLGGIDSEIQSEEIYVLRPIRLPATL